MTKHMPGPWFISSKFYIHNKPTKFDAQGARIGETPQRIATVESMVSDGSAESNAHLIAAAPDLLEALEKLLDMVTDSRLHGPEVFAAAEAIHKAKSEAPS